MKKFIINLVVFGIFVIALDFICGGLSGYLMSHAKGGATQNNNFIANKLGSDVIILGSSRATHHYVPTVIEDSTSYSSYNCGEEGNGSILAYGRFKMLTDRYTPKVVIYELTPEYDYFLDEDNSKYLKYLKPYYSNNHVKYLIDKFGNEFDNIKLLSNMYQNNGLFLTEIIDNVVKRDNNEGYSPLKGKLDLKKDLRRERKVRPIDSRKIDLLEEIIADCNAKKICLLFLISPRYKTVCDVGYFDYAIELANRAGIPVYDYSKMPDICDNPTFFNDPLHMNDEGAKFYTQKYVCDMIRNEMKRL